MRIRILLLFAIVTAVAVVADAQATPQTIPDGQIVDIGGSRLWMESAGKGGPTVVLDYGLGGPVTTWQEIFPEIAKFTRVIQYHRAGYGRSDAPATPRTFENVAKDMRAMLHAAKVPGPYVLVGHSLGNAHIRAFAHLYPNDVAGLVFIDPINARIFEVGLSDAQKAEEEKWKKEFYERAPDGGKAEMRFLESEGKDFKSLRSYVKMPDVPVTVLVAGRHEAGPIWTKSVIEEYGPFVYASPEGSLVVDPESGHYIHRDNLALVLSSIRRTVFPSVSRRLEKTLNEKGSVAAVAEYRELRKSYPADFFRESILNDLGYRQLRAKDVKGAIELFKLNVEMYPKAANPYDSLGEAYMADGQRELAIRNYSRSLNLNPQNTNAIEMLKKLRGQ